MGSYAYNLGEYESIKGQLHNILLTCLRIAVHPMKPHRVVMAHNLAVNYGLDKKMDILVGLSTPSLCSCAPS